VIGHEVLRLDAAAECARIGDEIRQAVLGTLRRKGAVLGLSGGIDSAVTAALCARTLGKERVFGLLMPERDSSGDSLRLGRMVAEALGIRAEVEDVSASLEALGCYRRQEEAIRLVFPRYGQGWKCRLTLPSLIAADRLPVFQLDVESPEGERASSRMPPGAYLQLVAATNFKQRARKMMEYYHADRLQYAVAGTPNLLEYDQGFFVKQGDGAADLKPIAHLYKSQVYALAEHLGIPEEIRRRPPTTDTFSMAQTQDEFYFPLPWADMDLCLWARNHGVAADQIAGALRLTPEQIGRVFKDIDGKRRATRYLHEAPLRFDLRS
jgi:NAD+ synthase